jgi:hypothetical protein
MMARAADTPLLRRERLSAKAGLVLRQVELLSLLWDEADEKAGFRPDQPRHPRGSGPIGGRWSGGAGTIIVEPAGGPPTRRGHHFIPRSVFEELDIPPEAHKVFNDAVTGKVPHGWSREHKAYNEAVRVHVQRYMRARGISPRKMTADQARAIIRSVLESENPDIKYFNRIVMMLRLIYQIRNKPPTGRK